MAKEENTHYTNLEPHDRPVPVVAIGGSAGGQKAISELLEHLPPSTGLAFVYIQHLSPTHDSRLPEILSKLTPMPVAEAEPLMHVKPDHLYIIPPNRDMEIVDGVLVLMPRKPRPHIHLPIDQFFISLSERQKDGAIGIVLSGMASDGTLGLQAIKVAGGITFAQDETAEYPSMPESAIREGVVDMVLSPKEIASELNRLSKHTDIFQLTQETEDSKQEDEPDKDLDKILMFLKTTVGMDFGHYKKSTIRRRIIRRMLLFKLEKLSQYVEYIKLHPGEAATLYDDLLINVTSFFRDEQTMVYVRKQVIPSVLKNKAPGEAIRFWVAGCSTGQEAYSLAMLLTEILGDRVTSTPIQIFATDLSETAIAKARLGVYTKSEMKDVSDQRLARFFTKIDDHYRINKSLRDLCVFAQHNLLSDPPFSRIDLVSCRNLLIYLDDILQKKALATFHYALTPDGVLLLGKSESVGTASSHFTQTDKDFKVFARKNRTLARIPGNIGSPDEINYTDARRSVKNEEVLSAAQLDKLVDNWLLSNFVPPSIIVDQDMEILQFRGSTSLFLEPAPGKASLNLSKMARPGLVLELRNAIHKARKTSQPAGKSGLEIVVADETRYVSIKAIPLTNPDNQQLFLILFEETKDHPVQAGISTEDADKRVLMLEAELAALRQDMHSIIEEQEASNEELQSANEEILSSNEELQSINEELETSKEEIESANEELQTINQELQIRNDQLTESYNYSEAILSTINEATLVVDEQLRIKVANRAFYKVFQTNEANTESSTIYELGNRQLDFEEFRNIMHGLVHGGSSISGYEVKIMVRPEEERVMRIHARRVLLSRRQTILLVFEDITEHRKAQKLAQERQEFQETLNERLNQRVEERTADLKTAYARLELVNAELGRTAESLQAVLDSSPASIGFFKTVYDEHSVPVDFVLIVCNRKFAHVFGKDVSALTEKTASQLYPVERVDIMLKVAISQVGHYEEIFSEQEKKWVGVSITRHDHGIAITELDINTLKHARLEQDELMHRLNDSYELIESLSALKEYVHHRGSILRSAFHDLRSSFGIISGAASLLNLMETEDDRRKNLEMIQRNLRVVAAMMNQLLDFARLETGEEELEISSFNVSETLRNLIESLKSAISAKRLSFDYDGPAELPIESDAPKIARLAQNLITNALKYTETGHIKVEWTDAELMGDRPQWRLVISDTGSGIPGWLVDRVIENDGNDNLRETSVEDPPLKMDDSVGLFIVKQLVRILGGKLQVETSSSGTRFDILLPKNHQ
ncbi:CheR family methyltransferase [Dyadobacter luticola]|uniref:histidine kinase n=1 Tax=Dyadobacter luticola TaxID=1979387 RepID=A0A5R9L4E4_9BACT|nr:CheR family methyltransferase [Dyadobacter luticola]TLV03413.1 chemotaxis protein CheR [Dyadobacter luticola]